jgi:hypothetical protein
MDKTFGEKKKFIKKKQKYSNHHSKASLNKPLRNYIKSYINHSYNNIENLENFILPSKRLNTNNWWDCKPLKPKVFSTHK